jgi:hypothetical protein
VSGTIQLQVGNAMQSHPVQGILVNNALHLKWGAAGLVTARLMDGGNALAGVTHKAHGAAPSGFLAQRLK